MRWRRQTAQGEIDQPDTPARAEKIGTDCSNDGLARAGSGGAYLHGMLHGMKLGDDRTVGQRTGWADGAWTEIEPADSGLGGGWAEEERAGGGSRERAVRGRQSRGVGAGALGRAEVVVMSCVRDADRTIWLVVLSGGED